MSFLLRYVPALLLVFFGLTVPMFAQSATSNKPARGTISGRITIKDKGAANVVVGVRKSNRANPFDVEQFMKIVTDQDGYYRITNLAAGSYEVVPAVPAFVISGPNNTTSKTVFVGDDENVDGINFSLVRGGVITGRVTDADGRPQIQQGVQVYRIEGADSPSPERLPSSSNAGATDDRGIYRLFGLVPGRYKISAGKADDTFVPPTGPGRPSFKQVFHPDVTDHAKATIIEVAEGSEKNNVDITLGRALQTFSASGRVVDEKNVPVANLQFGLRRSTGSQMEFVSTMALSNAQGDFIVEGLIPGKYGIFLFPTTNQGNDLRGQTTTFDIVDQDVTGITLKLSKGGSLSGIVTLETEDKTAFEKLTKLRLGALVFTGTGFGGMSSSPISPDGSFRISGLSPGTVNINLGSFPVPMASSGFTLVRIERDGVAVPRGIELKDGEHITGLRLVITYGTAKLRGVVKLENGTLPEGAMIDVRLTKQGENTSFFRPPEVDARGHFEMEGLAPGVYELSAQILGSNQPGPRTVKRDVVVQEGVATEIVITIDMTAPPPKP